jgi:hypothetical protein
MAKRKQADKEERDSLGMLQLLSETWYYHQRPYFEKKTDTIK